MTPTDQSLDAWEHQAERLPAETLVIDIDGFEGPLDLLLDLARSQKVDLAKISILALAEQYLDFVERVRSQRFELAGDYLVMAAWLAYLKSRLLLPVPPADDDEPSGEELAAILADRLRRLEAMRRAAARLMDGDRLGRNVFQRGEPQLRIERTSAYQASLFDLLGAYARQKKRSGTVVMRMPKRTVWALADARAILVRLVGRIAEWTPLEVFLSPYLQSPETRRTATASTFWASLELAREGHLQLQQSTAFGPLMMRAGPGERGAPDHG